MNFKIIHNRFISYTSSFLNNDDTNAHALKFKHSILVSNLARTIAEKEHFTKQQIENSAICGLLHDIGRFEQFEKYKTFNDKQSEDHAALSAKIIREQKMIADLSQTAQKSILTAIELHNKHTIPVTQLDESTRILAQTIRDADKLDILRIMVEEQKNPKLDTNTLFLNQKAKNNYSSAITQAIMENKLANLDDMSTSEDFRLIQLSWIFDINFASSFELLHQKNYIYQLIEQLPAQEKIKQEIAHILKTIKSHVHI
ncbi:MAG: HD domain-containing protein [Salinivirgaceae bacterium]